MTELNDASLPVQRLSQEDFAPFGQLLDCRAHPPVIINGGVTEKFADLAKIDVADEGGRPSLHLYRSQPRSLPFAVTTLERHPLGSQLFYPLRRAMYLLIVAPAGEFQPSALRCFLAGAGEGVNLAKGVWHHASFALRRSSDFLVIDRLGPGANLDEVQLDPPRLLSQIAVASALAQISA